jgi:hypothetical protein
MTARKTLVGTGFEGGTRPDPEERKIPDHLADESQATPAGDHKDVTGKPPPAPDSKDSHPTGPKSNP